MCWLVLPLVMVSLSAAAVEHNFPATLPIGCPDPIQKVARITPDPDGALPPALSEFIGQGYEVKTTFIDNGRFFVVVQKGGKSAWCETKISDDGLVTSKPCAEVGRRD